ncbi:hypothetical protein F5148DRAFT_11711 [Russula earlei]|uniref:Uncharacterized protein n=1 Tax=Russula earlei TaxID=71964 RepID=A0ACC0UR42_9AGAM|nr:hypothetical protein F5148DRAFT_11711 [Russula earlei]
MGRKGISSMAQIRQHGMTTSALHWMVRRPEREGFTLWFDLLDPQNSIRAPFKFVPTSTTPVTVYDLDSEQKSSSIRRHRYISAERQAAVVRAIDDNPMNGAPVVCVTYISFSYGADVAPIHSYLSCIAWSPTLPPISPTLRRYTIMMARPPHYQR